VKRYPEKIRRDPERESKETQKKSQMRPRKRDSAERHIKGDSITKRTFMCLSAESLFLGLM
jgi:hypothetical protein